MNYFTFQRDTGGVQVLRKGRCVEHLSGELLDTRTGLPTAKALHPIREACEKVEQLGLPANVSTAVWCYSWFRDCPEGSPLLPILRYTPGLYEHGFTEDHARKAKEHSCPAYPLVEPDGSCILVMPSRTLVKVTKGGTVCKEPLTLSEDSSGSDLYHLLADKDYHMAQCWQAYHLGPCYAEYAGLYDWFDNFGLTNPAKIQEVLRVARSAETVSV